MHLAEISFYNVVLFIHIAAVVLAFGVTFSFPIVLVLNALILIAIFLMVTKPGA